MRQITLMMPSTPVCCNDVTGFTTGRACTCALLQTHSRLQENDWFRRGYDRLSSTCALLQTHSRLQENDWFRRGYDRLSSTCALLQTHGRLQENDWFRRGYDRLSKFPECNGLVLSTFHRRGVNSDASQSLQNI